MEKQLLGELLGGLAEMSQSFSKMITNAHSRLNTNENHVQNAHFNAHDAESLRFDSDDIDWETVSEAECSPINDFRRSNDFITQNDNKMLNSPIRKDFKRSNDFVAQNNNKMPVYKKYTHPSYVIATYDEPFDYLFYEHVGQPVVYNRKQKPAKAFDCTKTDWADYLPQFLKIAEWNCWSTFEMATQLIMSFEGKSLKLLGQFDEDTKDNFHKLAYALNKYFDPSEQVESWKLKFKSRKRLRNESLLDLANDIKRLASKAYPNFHMEMQNMLILDQFIDSVKNEVDLYKHLRYGRPKSIDQAVSLGLEYEIVEQTEKLQKPHLGEVNVIQSHTMSHNNFNYNNQAQKGQPQNMNNNLVCFYCYRPGHKRVNCVQWQEKLKRDRNANPQRYGHVQNNHGYSGYNNNNNYDHRHNNSRPFVDSNAYSNQQYGQYNPQPNQGYMTNYQNNPMPKN